MKTIAYVEEGNPTAKPVVLVHGFPFNGGAWEKTSADLSRFFRVVTPDLRGFGRSPATSDVSLMSDFADDVKQLVDQLDLGPVALVGHSMGGYVVLDFVSRYPAAVRGIGLVATRPGPDSAEAAQKRTVTAKKVLAEGPEFLLADMAAKMVAPVSRTPEMIEAVIRLMTPADSKGVAAALMGMAKRKDFGAMLETLQIPALVLTGDEDELIPNEESGAMAAKLPQSELVVIPGAGHLVAYERAKEVSKVMAEWLNRL